MLNEVLENIKSRRSVRAYTEQQVSAEDLNLILEAATYAPSGMNFQTWHFTAIQDAAVLTELNEKIKGAFAKSDDARLQERGHSRTYCCYYHAPALIIVSNEPTCWWASMDCACALQNIFLAAKSLGIGSCWINQLGQTCDDPDVRAFLTQLGIPENHRVYGCAALGYAPADAPVKDKKLAEGTVTVIRGRCGTGGEYTFISPPECTTRRRGGRQTPPIRRNETPSAYSARCVWNTTPHRLYSILLRR